MPDDSPSPKHLAWLVESRAANQSAALKLYNLLEKHSTKVSDSKTAGNVQRLVAVCFSLWRSAFLADKIGGRASAVADAKKFLGKILVDNAIGYPQDRGTREWSFNYYIHSARQNLRTSSQEWTTVAVVLDQVPSLSKTGIKFTPTRRWTLYQRALDVALEAFEDHLIHLPASPASHTPTS